MQRLLAPLVDWMVLRALKGYFRTVYLAERCPVDPAVPTIMYANHHYWWDGYLMHLLARELRPGRAMIWMRELGAFQPFSLLGAMPFPEGDAVKRASTVRRSLRRLHREPALLFIFPEGESHPAPKVDPFLPGLYWLAKRLPEVAFVPLAIHIEQATEQFPVAYLQTGEPLELSPDRRRPWLEAARQPVVDMLAELRDPQRREKLDLRLLLEGRPSMQERRCSKPRGRGEPPRPVARGAATTESADPPPTREGNSR
ncbi:MAG: hypothetical protein GF320_06900 [Armatimonadia bacterium]|nr:hypothetical protein [Armatimonadia bacterium]